MLLFFIFALGLTATIAKPTDLLHSHNHHTPGNYQYKYVLDRVSLSEKKKNNPLADYTFIDPEDTSRKSFVVENAQINYQAYLAQAEKNYVDALRLASKFTSAMPKRAPITKQVDASPHRFLISGAIPDTPEVIEARKRHLAIYQSLSH